jgi:lysocardiolipin and lysophospholipid acyltransferase
MWFLDFVFLSRNWYSDSVPIQKTFQRLNSSELPFWVICHAEGTRLSPKKLEISQKFAKANDLPILNNVLIPRTKGFCALIEGLRSRCDSVYDFTIVYDHQRITPPSAIGFVLSRFLVKPIQVNVHVRRWKISEIPKERGQLEAWLVKVWQEKEELIENFFKIGKFPNEQNIPLRHRFFQLKQ